MQSTHSKKQKKKKAKSLLSLSIITVPPNPLYQLLVVTCHHVCHHHHSQSKSKSNEIEVEVEVEADHETYFFCKLNVRCTFLPS